MALLAVIVFALLLLALAVAAHGVALYNGLERGHAAGALMRP